MKHKAWEKGMALLMAMVLLVGGLSLGSWTTGNVHAAEGPITVDGAAADWEGVPEAKTVAGQYFDSFAGANIGGVSVTNDTNNLYLKVQGTFPNWGNDGMFLDIAIDVKGTAEAGADKSAPWGGQYNYNNTAEAPDIHILARHSFGAADKINGIEVKKGTETVAGNAVLNGASFAMGDGSEPSVDGGAYGDILTASIPLSLLGLSADSQIRALAVMSGNNAGEHGAFDVFPKTYDNPVAATYNSFSAPESMASYSNYYTVSAADESASYTELGFDNLKKVGMGSTILGDVKLYNDASDLYFYIDTDRIDTDNNSKSIILGLNEEGVDAGTVPAAYSSFVDLTGLSNKPQCYLEYQPADGSVQFRGADGTVSDKTDIVVKHTANGVEGKLPLSKTGMAANDKLCLFTMWADMAANEVYSIAPHDKTNACTSDTTAAAAQYSKVYTIRDAVREPIALAPDTFTDLGGEAWYLRGGITPNGWDGCNAVNQFSRITKNLYGASYILNAGTYEFKAATADWGKSIGIDGASNFTIKLDDKSKINFYIRTDTAKMWLCGQNQYGEALTSSMITTVGSNLNMYTKPADYTDANWPRLVGTIQTALGEPADWSPSTSQLLMQDYDMNGTVFAYECTLPANNYQVKTTLGTGWDTAYGAAGGGNLEVSAAADSKVVFTIDLSSADPVLSAAAESAELKAAADFPLADVPTGRKTFAFKFSEAVSLEPGKTIADCISISPAASVEKIELSAADAKVLEVTLADTNTFANDKDYTFTLQGGYFKTTAGLVNETQTFSFRTKAAGPVIADEFTNLAGGDKYVVTGNFQKLGGESGTWVPTSKATQMKRITGDLYAYSIVLPASADADLPNNEEKYAFKVVKNGDYDDPGSFAGGTGGYGNYEFTLEEASKLTLFINTETHTIVSSLDIPNIPIYSYKQSALPRLVGSIQTLFGEPSDNFAAAGQVLYDYYLDGSEYRLERKLGPTNRTYTAKAYSEEGGQIGSTLNLGAMSRAIDTTFTLKNNTFAQEFNIYTPTFTIDTAPANIQKGTSYQFRTGFCDEFREEKRPQGVVWNLGTPIEGVSLDANGRLTVSSTVPDDTQITVEAAYTYRNGFTPDLNKTYTASFTVKAVPVVTNFKFNYLRYAEDYDGWNLWVWQDGKDGVKKDVLALNNGWYSGVVSVPEAVDKINFITRKGEWSDQEGGNRIFDLSRGSEIWLVQGDKNVYYSREEAVKPKIFSAAMNDANQIVFTVSGSKDAVDFSRFTAFVNGEQVDAAACQGSSDTQGIMTLQNEVKPSDVVEVRDLEGIYSPAVVTMRKNLDAYYYDGDDLGLTKTSAGYGFKVWAPTAKKVSLALYRNAGSYNADGSVTNQTPDALRDMTWDDTTGVWSTELAEASGYFYYMYKVEFGDGTTNYAVDPYARSVSANGQRTAIINLDETDPANWKPESKPDTVTYAADHVLYELQVRDFSIDPSAGFANKGKFAALTETGLKDGEGNAIGIDYLKELGITTVHLMPTYDFQAVNELTVDHPSSTDRKYNWGYDPQNYNVPEGSYSTDPTNPTARITEFKEMVQSLHDAGIRVVLDVVYNHTYDIETGPFNKIVPGYFYRVNESGEFSNGSGCGNEVASENPMVRKYIIDSVKYWAEEYNVDGFRFDLFGLIDQETAKQLTRELQTEVDPTIMVYGEPWYADSTPLGSGGVSKGAQKDNGYAVFNDNIRGAIKGGSDDASAGFATGAAGKEADVVKGIRGSVDDFTNAPTETINYVTAHDNLNLWDKVVTAQGLNDTLNMLFHKMKDGAMLDGSSVETAVAHATPYAQVDKDDPFANETVKRTVLANSMVLTMQGVPFIQAGDEFLRSKYGDHNSYRSPDAVNMIRWENRTEYSEVVDYYEGLLQMRKEHPAFRMNTKAALENNLVVCKSDNNQIVYVLKNHANGDTWNNIAVIYNGNNASQAVNLGSFADTAGVLDWNIAVNGTQAGTASLGMTGGKTVNVPALSTMVLYDTQSAPSATVGSITAGKDSVSITPEQEMLVQVVLRNDNHAIMKNAPFTVSSSDTGIAEAVANSSYTKIKITGKGTGSAVITVADPSDTSVKAVIQVNVVGVSATVSQESADSGENPVICVDTGGMDISSITADLRAVGGSSKYEISKITKEISFGIKNYISPGVKTIPVTITDTAGNVYKTKTKITVAKAADGTDWDESVIYFMLTDRFYDGNTGNNGALVDKNDSGAYHGGDFAGVTQKLDYLKDLGVNTVWITPIVENTEMNCTTPEELAKGNNYYGYHGYWATDFKELNPYLGTKDELCALIDAAHDRGIKIMVDVVLNHAGYFDSSYPYKDTGINGMLRAESVVDGDERQWISGLPDFETENQSVRQQLIDWQTAWAELTTDRGDSIDYFRVDTVKHVEHETWKQFKTALARSNSEFKLIGEVFDSDSKINSYLNDGEMDSALDFSFKDIARSFAADGELEEAEKQLEARNARISNTGTLGQFLSSHDEDGFLAVTLGGDEAKMMAAAALQITAKGQPVIYYGEEIGQSGANNWPVYDNRKDFDWSKVNDSNQMLSHYKKLLNIRSEYSDVFAKGSRRKAAGSNDEELMVFSRSYSGNSVYVAINTADTAQKVTFPVGSKGGRILTDLYSGKAYMVDAGGKVTVTVPAMKNGGTLIIPVEKLPGEPDEPDDPANPDIPVITPPDSPVIQLPDALNPGGNKAVKAKKKGGIKKPVSLKDIQETEDAADTDDGKMEEGVNEAAKEQDKGDGAGAKDNQEEKPLWKRVVPVVAAVVGVGAVAAAVTVGAVSAGAGAGTGSSLGRKKKRWHWKKK